MKYFLCALLIAGTFSCTSTKKEQQPATYPIGQILTNKGEMLFWLSEETPKHKASFLKLAEEKFWDSLTFNRVIKDFVIQGGCPDTPEGFGDSPYLIEPEFKDHLKHVYGAVGAGRDGNPEKLSAGCQLYIVHDKDGIPRLDGDYMIFGQVFKGLDVLDAIANVETDSLDQPLSSVTMKVNVLEFSKKELSAMGFDVANIK